jgi:hypothetical protein
MHFWIIKLWKTALALIFSCHITCNYSVTSLKTFHALYMKRNTNKSIFKILFLCVTKCILIISQHNVFTGTGNMNIHIKLHLRTCCNLVNTETVIISQFSPTSLLLLFQLVSLACQDVIYFSLSATAAEPDATNFFFGGGGGGGGRYAWIYQAIIWQTDQ